MRVISYLNLLQDYNYTHYAADAIVIGTTQILIQFLPFLLKRATVIEMDTEKNSNTKVLSKRLSSTFYIHTSI